jgi:stage III sporulation protein AF
MSYITEWITNIILFILFAIVIELLIPNNSFQRYVKMVIGLLLIVIILTPILKIFNTNVDEMFTDMNVSSIFQEKKVENSIENKKKEIQASQRAYIEEQMAVQMERQVREELWKEHGYQIQKIELVLPEEESIEDHVEEVHVRVQKVKKGEGLDEDSNTIKTVQVVKIEVDIENPKQEKKSKENFQTIESFLASEWELPEKKVKVKLEGGEKIGYEG